MFNCGLSCFANFLFTNVLGMRYAFFINVIDDLLRIKRFFVCILRISERKTCRDREKKNDELFHGLNDKF